MRDTYPGYAEPNDGASVLVVEGRGAGMCGFQSSMDLIVYVTVAAINSGRRVVTSIAPQRYESGSSQCLATTQDWKNVTLQLISRVVEGAPSYGTYWGGIMLNEEDGFWEPQSQSAAAYLDINMGVQDQINLLAPNGITWYYTETFSGEGVWGYGSLLNLSYYSVPAPEVATSYMVGATNHFTDVDPSREILVTWSGDYPIGTMFEAVYPINGPSYSEWGLNLTNCFGGGASQYPCNDWDFDLVTNPFDNCIYIANGGQENSDANYVDMPPPLADDLTWPHSDSFGDECDDDDDNDARTDTLEFVDCAGSGTTNPVNRDTDGDRVLDGPECLLGTNGSDAGSKPPLSACGSSADTDGDRLSDRFEFCLYYSFANTIDTDGDRYIDGARDGCEVASINGDRTVTSGDQGLLAAFVAGIYPYHSNPDLNKDGGINSGDQGFMSQLIQPAGQCP